MTDREFSPFERRISDEDHRPQVSASRASMKPQTMLSLLPYAMRMLRSTLKSFVMRLRGMQIGKRVIIGRVRFRVPPGNVSIGDGVVIGDGVQFDNIRSLVIKDYSKIHDNVRVAGEENNVALQIGYNSWIGEETLIDCKRNVTIGNDVGIGCRSQIWTHGYFPAIADGNPCSFGDVVIEDGAWLPPACIILPGVVVGQNCIVGTGSVITKDIPPRTFATGIPCKVRLEDESRFRRSLAQQEKVDTVLERCLAYLKSRGAQVRKVNTDTWRCRFMLREFYLSYRENPCDPAPEKQRLCLFTWIRPNNIADFSSTTTLFVLSENRYTKRRTFHEWVVIRALLDRCTLRVTPIEQVL